MDAERDALSAVEMEPKRQLAGAVSRMQLPKFWKSFIQIYSV
jgi:hypothetical protein